jgi:hypothetical protein
MDSTVRAQNWDDLNQWLVDRIQDCIDQGMSSGGADLNDSGSSDSNSAGSTKKRHKD